MVPVICAQYTIIDITHNPQELLIKFQLIQHLSIIIMDHQDSLISKRENQYKWRVLRYYVLSGYLNLIIKNQDVFGFNKNNIIYL